MRNDELWLKKIEERFDDHIESLPPMGWEKLEKELPTKTIKRKMYPPVWIGAAASIALVLGLFSFFYFTSNSAIQETLVNPVVSQVSEEVDEQILPTQKPATKNSFVAQQKKEVIQEADPIKSISNQPLPIHKEEMELEVKDQLNREVPVEKGEVENENGDVIIDKEAEKRRRYEEAVAKYTQKKREGDSRPASSYTPTKERKNKNWSIGLGTGGGAGLGSTGQTTQSPMYANNVSLLGNKYTEQIAQNQTLEFRNGMAYVSEPTASYDHKMPISFGVSVRKQLLNRLYLESGITYTYLRSDVSWPNSSAKEQQKLHYLGIPVKLNYNLINQQLFSVYLSGGGAIERCVYASQGGKHKTLNDMQFSLTGGLGIQVNLSRNLSLYFEPGVSYFFDDGSDFETIRKDHKFNIDLKAGFRVTY